MKAYKCECCDKICDVIEIEDGGYEEIWGARIFHSQKTDVSDCCHEAFEEITDLKEIEKLEYES